MAFETRKVDFVHRQIDPSTCCWLFLARIVSPPTNACSSKVQRKLLEIPKEYILSALHGLNQGFGANFILDILVTYALVDCRNKQIYLSFLLLLPLLFFPRKRSCLKHELTNRNDSKVSVRSKTGSTGAGVQVLRYCKRYW